MASFIKGFSKLSRKERIDALKNQFAEIQGLEDVLNSFLHKDDSLQQTFNEFSENTLSNYYLPFGIAPNFLIDESIFHIPMVIEESSVVAAASYSARFWAGNGGFRTKVISMHKPGHVHLHWPGNFQVLLSWFDKRKEEILLALKPLTRRMEKRGGGIVDMRLNDLADKMPAYRQIEVIFDTADAMGANFINSCLEETGKQFLKLAGESPEINKNPPQVIMAILSNYTPECIVNCKIECPVEALKPVAAGLKPADFAWKFQQAVDMANVDPFRAATHNKGIFNGIDAVVLATGNDFRAVEAGAHTYAASKGSYRGLTNIELRNGYFAYELDVPLSLGTVGGLTSLHPLAKLAMEMLGNPGAKQLMGIAAAAGMANNFAAVRSLITQGIQKGHMKMHLNNILNQMGASEKEKTAARDAFLNKTVTYQEVREFVENARK